MAGTGGDEAPIYLCSIHGAQPKLLQQASHFLALLFVFLLRDTIFFPCRVPQSVHQSQHPC